MKYRLLGKSGLRVSEAALGTMTFGDEWGWGSPKAEAQKVYETYREAGGNFLDTANFCTGGTSEKFVGEFIKGHRDSIVLEQPIEMMSVATQVCHLRLRAVRPKHDAPKEATPRTKSMRSSVQCAAAKKPAEVTRTARPQ